jgi:predicted nuclease with TOPRIM domain
MEALKPVEQLQEEIERIKSEWIAERTGLIQERDKYRKESATHRDEIAKLTARLTAETSALRNELDDVSCQLADTKRKFAQITNVARNARRISPVCISYYYRTILVTDCA